jgi:rhodanese-related sulfurtransferase
MALRLAAIPFLPRLLRRWRYAGTFQWIEAEDLARRLKRGSDSVIIDVRGPDEFTGPLGHIADARNLPIGDFPERLRELEPNKHRSIVLVCRTDRRSARGAALLRDAGFRDVHVLRGGMEGWNQNGLPVENRVRC